MLKYLHIKYIIIVCNTVHSKNVNRNTNGSCGNKYSPPEGFELMESELYVMNSSCKTNQSGNI